jgi:rubredoxin
VTRMRCADCGIVYEPAAVARHLALATGCTCRRCGGSLEADERAEDRRRARPRVVAVRSAVTGHPRLPFA